MRTAKLKKIKNKTKQHPIYISARFVVLGFMQAEHMLPEIEERQLVEAPSLVVDVLKTHANGNVLGRQLPKRSAYPLTRQPFVLL